MTLRGFVITLLELVLLIFALGTEMHEFLIVALCVGVLEAYSLVSILLASVTLSLKSKIDKSSAMREDVAKYTLSLRGVALLPVAGYLSIKNADYVPKKQKRHKYSFLMLPSFVIEHKFEFNIHCGHIGLWEVGVAKLRFEDLFGLFSMPLLRSTKVKTFSKLWVMPKTHTLKNDTETISLGDYGLTNILDSEQGELLGDSRLYREGDTLKRINWKLSARTKQLYSRQYERLQNPNIVIALDTAVLEEAKGDIIDISTETAISLANYFVNKNHTVEIVLLRNEQGLDNETFKLANENDVRKMQFNLANTVFYASQEQLNLTANDNKYIVGADKIFLISSNPSPATISDFTDYCNNGKLARCIIPAPIFEETEEENLEQEVTVKITDTAKIKEKVGGVL